MYIYFVIIVLNMKLKYMFSNLCLFSLLGGSIRKPPKVETAKPKKPPSNGNGNGKPKKKETPPPKSDPYFAMETEQLDVYMYMFSLTFKKPVA